MTLHRVAHHLRRGADQNGGDGDDHDGGQRLQQRRGERQRDAAPPGLLIGEQVGRDHRLAVAWAGGMENAVDERDAHQSPIGRAIGLGCADEAGQRAVEQRLLGEDPAGDAGDRRRAKGAERSGLRRRGVCQRVRGQRQHQDHRRQSNAAGQPRPGAALHGQFTAIRLAKFAPMPILASEVWKA